MSNAALESQSDEMPEDPQAWREEFRRRMAERGLAVRLPTHDPDWTLPEPLPIDAGELGRFVAELRELGKL